VQTSMHSSDGMCRGSFSHHHPLYTTSLLGCQSYLYKIYYLVHKKIRETKQNQVKRKQCKQWFMKRNSFSNIDWINELRMELDDSRNYLRMEEKHQSNYCL
jgi:hypothetical protein